MKKFTEYKKILRKLYEVGAEVLAEYEDSENIAEEYADEVENMQEHLTICAQFLDFDIEE